MFPILLELICSLKGLLRAKREGVFNLERVVPHLSLIGAGIRGEGTALFFDKKVLLFEIICGNPQVTLLT